MWVLYFLAVAVAIALVVWLIRRFVPGLADNEKEDPEKISRDNIERLIVTPKEENEKVVEDEEDPNEDELDSKE